MKITFIELFLFRMKKISLGSECIYLLYYDVTPSWLLYVPLKRMCDVAGCFLLLSKISYTTASKLLISSCRMKVLGCIEHSIVAFILFSNAFLFIIIY